MTEIFFYSNIANINKWVFKLSEKALEVERNLVIVADKELADVLSLGLWSWRDTSFISNNFQESSSRLDTVVFGDNPTLTHHDTMVNLRDQIPSRFSSFKRICEYVSNNPTQKNNAREKYNWYKHRGYPITIHRVSRI
jgi:DNA polymerase-3 subunit chi